MLRLLLVLVLTLLPVPNAALGAPGDDAPEDPYAKVLERYRKAIAKRPSVEKALEAVTWLDPDEPRSLPELLALLRTGHWMVRGRAMEALARISPGPLRSELRLHLVAHEDLWVREGIAYAMALDARPGDGEALAGALEDAAWRVRRTAARALGEIVSKEGVRTLIETLETETDLRVVVWIKASLRAIAGTDLGSDPRRWREWWERNKDRPEWKRQGEEVRRDEFDGVPLETITIGGPPPGEGTSEAERKRRPDLFVLAPFGFNHDWFRPSLDEAARFVRITYVTLPTVQEVTGHSGYGASIPRYPVRKLARALDSLRKKLGKDQVVLLASGPVCWIAETYALEYRKHVSGLVLMNGWLDSQSYAASLLRRAGRGSPTERWVAKLLTGEIEPRHDREEGERIRRILLTHTLADRRDSEGYRLWTVASRQHGFVVVPPLHFGKKTRIHTPTLFTFPDPELSLASGAQDADLRRIRDAFEKPPPVIAPMRESRGLYHVEDLEEFLRVLSGFLDYAGVTRR